MSILRRVAYLIPLAAFAFAAPAMAQANVDVEFRGGLAVPAGDLNEVGRAGGAFGLGFSRALTSRLAVRVDGDLELLSERRVGSDVIMPRTFLWHYHAGLELDVLQGGEASPWRVSLRGGGGGTTYDTELFEQGGDDFLDTYFSVSGGAAIGRRVRQGVELGVVGQTYIVFTDKDRTEEIAERSPLLNTFSKASSFPVTIYLRWSR